jgi:hypothetical protein
VATAVFHLASHSYFRPITKNYCYLFSQLLFLINLQLMKYFQLNASIIIFN